MKFVDFFGVIVGAITVVSVLVNVIQYYRRKQEGRSLRELVQGNYNKFFLIARCCTRTRTADPGDDKAQLNEVVDEMSVIRGIADASRIQLIAFGREHLKYTPFYEHPAYPGKSQPDEVILGRAPELVDEKK